jgi:methylmalonyl-CoA/ethylmalonyl-CoA epimerase
VPEGLFRPQLGEAHHRAYVVEDIETTVRRLVDRLGAGPFFLIENVPLEKVLSRGEPAEFVHNSGFGSCGGGAIELIEPVSLAPARVEKGFTAPPAAIQHVAYVVPATAVVCTTSSRW